MKGSRGYVRWEWNLDRIGSWIAGVGALMVVALTCFISTAGASAAPLVENARAVTGGFDPSRIYQSPNIAVDPANPNTVALVVGNYHYPGGCYLYVSQDGGRSWGAPASLLPAGTQFCGDRPIAGRLEAPVFASNGTLYVGFSGAPGGQQFPNTPSSAFFTRSSDLGLTTPTATVSATHMVSSGKMGSGGGMMGSGGGMGANSSSGSGMTQARGFSVAVDPSNPNTVYMGWLLTTTTPSGFKGSISPTFSVLGNEQSLVSVSHDGGRTWSMPVNLTTAYGHPTIPSGGGSETPQLLAARGGTVYAITDTAAASGAMGMSAVNKLVMYKSTNGGRTWQASLIPFSVPHGYQSIFEPQAAIDSNTGEIYVAFNTQAGKPGSGVGANSVYVLHSSDGGRTWSAPANVVDPAARYVYDQYDPGISVAPNGRVSVAWIDFRSDPYYRLGPSGNPASGSSSGERYYDIYAAYSTDHGATWSKNLRVSDQTIDASLGAEFPDYAVLPVGIASTNSKMYVAWGNPVAGAPPATPEDSYFTAIDFSPIGAVATTSSTSSGTKAAWAVIGAGIAFALAGLILVFTRRREIRRPSVPEPEKETVGSGAPFD